ncbi:MAG: hypothetical protein QOI83_17, partial [Streptomycetaceae bacterium]|nr:hypothetical protein [Streptomycetaceae bacterium]
KAGHPERWRPLSFECFGRGAGGPSASGSGEAGLAGALPRRIPSRGTSDAAPPARDRGPSGRGTPGPDREGARLGAGRSAGRPGTRAGPRGGVTLAPAALSPPRLFPAPSNMRLAHRGGSRPRPAPYALAGVVGPPVLKRRTGWIVDRCGQAYRRAMGAPPMPSKAMGEGGHNPPTGPRREAPPAPGGRQRLRTPGDTATRPTSANSANVASASATTSVAPPTTFS